jgi:hypothetical protein
MNRPIIRLTGCYLSFGTLSRASRRSEEPEILCSGFLFLSCSRRRPGRITYRYQRLTPRFDRLASACVRTELIFDPQFNDLSSVRG